MGAHRYMAWNGPMPTTAAQASVAVANGVKTMLQIAAPSTRQLQIVEWGFSVDVAPGGIGTVELIQTDVAATVTAHVAAGVQPLTPGLPASLVTLGTSATGYTASVEGSTTASRVFDAQAFPSAAGTELRYVHQFMPDNRPIVAVSTFLRVRTTFTSTTPKMLAYVIWEE